MSDLTHQKFTVDITNIKNPNQKSLLFEINGNKEYCLNKSFVNAIRRTLLKDIKTIAFNDDDIIIE